MIVDDRTRLGSTLKELRRGVGLRGFDVCARTGISQSKISKLETGKLLPSPRDLEVLCSIYRATAEERAEMVGLVEQIREDSRRVRIVAGGGSARVQEKVRQIESRATLLRSFEATIVNGLMQTPAYAEAVFAQVLESPEDVRESVATRLRRQAALDDRSKQFVIIHTEGALRWQAGSPAVMAEQIDVIVEASRRPNVRVGIIPWTKPVGVFPRHGWHMYDNAMVIVGIESGSATFTEDEDVAVYTEIFGHLEGLASFGDDARRELARIAGEYRLLS